MRKVDRDVKMLTPSVDINLIGTLNFFKALEALKISPQVFVQIGSQDEYGLSKVPYQEDQREKPTSPYSTSKLAATHFCQMLHRSLGYPNVIIRPCLIYGPAQATDMFIPMLIHTCFANKDFPMTSGEQTRDFGYVGDVVDGILLAAQTPKAIGEIINIGTGEEVSIKNVALKIVELTKSKTQLQFGVVPKRASEIEHLYCDNSKAKQLLGWSPKISLEAGLKETIEWYRMAM
jgi:nucleoside-diphosphate-sugar epimerase